MVALTLFVLDPRLISCAPSGHSIGGCAADNSFLRARATSTAKSSHSAMSWAVVLPGTIWGIGTPWVVVDGGWCWLVLSGVVALSISVGKAVAFLFSLRAD